MRVWHIPQFGLHHLSQAERDDPQCGPGQVQIAVGAVSLNYRDLLTISGLYNPRQPLPLVPCSDGVGRVAAVGEGVSRVVVGDRVASVFMRDWIGGPVDWPFVRTTGGGPLDGLLAEQVVLPEHAVVKLPEHLSDAEAATLPCAGVTAWNAVVGQGGVRAGQTVLLQGTGGVSIFALQFAKQVGAQVIITSSSDEKLERARALGADHTINYKTDERWGKTAKKCSGGGGVDLVVEVGGAGTMKQSLSALRMGGRIALIGNLAGNEGPLSYTGVLMRQVRIQGILVGSRADFEAMNRAVDVGQLRPVVDRVFPFDEAVEACQHLASGKHFGKVCIQVGSGGAEPRA